MYFFYSAEPGYYEDGSFGIRHETAVVVVKANTPVGISGKYVWTYRYKL